MRGFFFWLLGVLLLTVPGPVRGQSALIVPLAPPKHSLTGLIQPNG